MDIIATNVLVDPQTEADIYRIAQSIMLGIPFDDIHSNYVIDGGMSEEDFYLNYNAALILSSLGA